MPAEPRSFPFALATLLVALVLAASCATSGVNRGDLNLVSLEDEWRLGQQLEADIAKKVRLVNDRAAVRYVDRMGQRIVSRTELAELPWEFHIVADDSVNAFNVPGGHVYVHSGLIRAAGSASELAGVMAHEIAHGVARHGTEQLTRAQGLSIVAGVALGQNPGAVEQIATQILGGGALAKFSRNAEREADELGVRHMHAAGYDPRGMAEMFEVLLEERRRRPSSVERFFSSHPLTESRIAEVREDAAELGSGANLIRDDPGFRELQRRLGG